MKEKRGFAAGAGLMLLFVVWTVLVKCVDVQSVGPEGSRVGFAALNVWFHNLTGVHMGIYTATDALGLVPFAVCAGFGVLGLVQWIQRKSLLRVDADLLLLGVYYVLVIAAYLLFEALCLNYRPILIEGVLEASYPSSTTLLVLSVMPTLQFQTDRRARSVPVKRAVTVFVVLFSAFMVLGRLTAGVHWLTDIAGGVLLSAGLFVLYRSAVRYAEGGPKTV